MDKQTKVEQLMTLVGGLQGSEDVAQDRAAAVEMLFDLQRAGAGSDPRWATQIRMASETIDDLLGDHMVGYYVDWNYDLDAPEMDVEW